MNEKEITVKELLILLRKKWYWTVIIAAVIFACIYFTNANMFNKIDENAYYSWELDIDIDVATTTELKEAAEEVIRSDAFREKVKDEFGLELDEEFLNNIVYGQTSSNEGNASIFKVRVLASSKQSREISEFFAALCTSGEELLEKKFKSNVSFSYKKITRIVAGKGANLNLAANYVEYRNMHQPNTRNILIWLAMSVMLGFAGELAISLIGNPFKKNK